MASQMNPDLSNSLPDPAPLPAAQPAPPAASEAASERFTLPTASRVGSLPLEREEREERDEPGGARQVLGAAPAASDSASALPASSGRELEQSEEAAIAGVREREARARLLALRRIEWVALALVAVLLGGAAWSWRSHSDLREGRREAFNGSPLPYKPDKPGGRDGARPAPRQRRIGRPAPSWRPARPAEVRGASLAIRSQLDAFKRDDYLAAEVWQSEALKRKFGTVSAFRRAIRENFPAFSAYKGVRFGEALALSDGAAVRIKLLLQGPQGESVPAEYILVRESGAYRIDAVSAPTAREPEEPAPPSPPAEAA